MKTLEIAQPSRAELSAAPRYMVLAGVVLSVLVLLPGLFLPALTVRGTLNPDGVQDLARRLMPPALQSTMGQFVGAGLAQSLRSGEPIEVYIQTRSVVASILRLYQVGSTTAATLILLFSVIVPVTKSLLVVWAVVQKDPARRRRTLFFVETIAKWSMVDVFAIAVLIAFLAAQASQTVGTASAVVFDARFGPGFYWFAAYCLTSLASQQAAARWLRWNGE